MSERRTSRLWVRNTSRYPMAEVWPLCMAALESVERSLKPGEIMPAVIVKLTNTRKCWGGLAYWTERHEGKLWKRVLVRIGPPERFQKPVSATDRRFADMPEFTVDSHREALIMVAAHEMEHTLGASGRKAGEMTCDFSGSDAVDYYRANKARIDGGIAESISKVAARLIAKVQTPEKKKAAKLAKAQADLARWKRRLTIAKNKVRKYDRAVRRLSKPEVIALPDQAQPPFEQAASCPAKAL